MTSGQTYTLLNLIIPQDTLSLTLIYPLYTPYTLGVFMCGPHSSHQYHPSTCCPQLSYDPMNDIVGLLLEYSLGIHHLGMDMYHGCHPIPLKSLPTINHPLLLKPHHPIMTIVTQYDHKVFGLDFKMDLFTMKLTNPLEHPHFQSNLPPNHPLHPRYICAWFAWFPSILPIYLLVRAPL